MWIEFADAELEELIAAGGALLRLEPMSTLHIGRADPRADQQEARGHRAGRVGPDARASWHRAPVSANDSEPTSLRRIDSPI